ncbi:MAG: metalloendopeptidase [Paenibacillaceae bacterium]|nr:metalloendopeptidase [Paenibacillaceae bacterium]
MKKFLSLTVLAIVLAIAPLATAFAADSDYGDLGWHYITANYEITSPYGWRGSEFHKGFDIGVNEENAWSISAGTVLLAGYSSSAGNWVVIQSDDQDPNGNNLTARYLHLKGYAVWTGKSVISGEYLGVTGNTGDSTGPHLHFDVNNQNKINGSDITSSNTIDPTLFWPDANWVYPSLLRTSSADSTYKEGDIDLTKAIPDYLIDYVGKTAFENWLAKNEVDYTVLDNFVKDFNIPQKDINNIKTNFITKSNAAVK